MSKTVDRPRCVVIGRKPPPGYREVTAMHFGKGMWAISCEKILPGEPGYDDGRKSPPRKRRGGSR